MRSDEFYMHRALEAAREALELDEVPVGAVVVNALGEVIGQGFNQPRSSLDPTAHAEVQALRMASLHVDNYRLSGCTLYVTLEPCMMCLGAMITARVDHLVYGAPEPRTGMIQSRANLIDQPWFNHRLSHRGGVLAAASRRLLKAFFDARR
ncbi:tRNA adenosine(34) deaminase TadA [Larsenimonas rhizosphaerae]|uniref:tRNA adenosine(34) deaminase TadA n=1 Tax=Larsenimonas rhizosphaerae TaxID=2944682 RepID=UPI0020336AE2|nr:tRNA adenosine(34) deaminase TadA [Larsenimonas rhizosphaerae]MCM2130098.1 tRNA adenosine(34) deaminase TadA [Larsenimonas rhizosphaerae]